MRIDKKIKPKYSSHYICEELLPLLLADEKQKKTIQQTKFEYFAKNISACLTEEFIAELEATQFDLNVEIGGQTLLGIALQSMVKRLDHSDECSNKDIMYVLSKLPIISALLEAGADPNHRSVTKAWQCLLRIKNAPLNLKIQLSELMLWHHAVLELPDQLENDNVLDYKIYFTPVEFWLLVAENPFLSLFKESKASLGLETGMIGETILHTIAKDRKNIEKNLAAYKKLFPFIKELSKVLELKVSQDNTVLLEAVNTYSKETAEDYWNNSLSYLNLEIPNLEIPDNDCNIGSKSYPKAVYFREFIILLLQMKANIFAAGHNGKNIFHLSTSPWLTDLIESNYGLDTIKILLETKDSDGNIPLHYTQTGSLKSLVDLYKRANVSIHFVNYAGENALFRQNGYHHNNEGFFLLIKEGLNPFHRNHKGETPQKKFYIENHSIFNSNPHLAHFNNQKQKIAFLSCLDSKKHPDSPLRVLKQSAVFDRNLLREIFSFMPQLHNDFDHYEDFFTAEKESLLRPFKSLKELKDFDNDSIINVASQLLKNFNVPESSFIALRVGPTKPTEPWSLAAQLSKLLKLPDIKNRRFIFFAIPTNQGRHAVIAVIDTERKEIHCLDSKGKTLRVIISGKETNTYQEAIDFLEECIRSIPFLKDYKLVIADLYDHWAQQGLNDNTTCGIHGCMNIVGIICYLRVSNKKQVNDVEKPQYEQFCPHEILIDLKTGMNSDTNRDKHIDRLTGIALLALRGFQENARKKTNTLPQSLDMAFAEEHAADAKASEGSGLILQTYKS